MLNIENLVQKHKVTHNLHSWSKSAPHLAFETLHNARHNQLTDSVEWKRERERERESGITLWGKSLQRPAAAYVARWLLYIGPQHAYQLSSPTFSTFLLLKFSMFGKFGKKFATYQVGKLSCTDVAGYSDTVYSDTPLIWHSEQVPNDRFVSKIPLLTVTIW